ncbi:MAG: LytTR family transcriptional regulator [Clostridiaceae bacterium]|nr:LytTR family transcriptional regulator [Clostridiaceae bacterium]
MRVQIKRIRELSDECTTIECVEITPDIESIRTYALSKGTTLTGMVGERIYNFNLSEVIYFEAVDEKVFANTHHMTFELKYRLYELERSYENKHFIRCAKAFVINLMMLESISPAMNGRFIAHMKNKENVIISRQYVPALKQAVMGAAKGASK